MKEIVYDQYQFNWRDWMEYGAKLLLKSMVICYLFYDTYKAWIIMLPLGILEYKSLKKVKIMKQKRELTMQFKSLIESVATTLSAGYSLERAFEEAKKDLLLIYTAKEHIFTELDFITSGLKMNIPIERLLKNFGQRSCVDDIEDFANVVNVAKRSGGNLVHIIQKTVNRIVDKLMVEEEIETMIAAKRYEERVMMIMPYGIILYLRWSNEGFFDVLYGNILGAFVMTAFLVVIYIADFWAKKIMEIQV